MAEFDWGKAYMKGLRQGGPGGTGYVPGVNPEGVMYANELITSGKNIGSGQGGFLDYLNVLLAPTALAGYGGFRGAQAAARSPQAARALALQALRNPNIASRQGVDVLEQMARSGDTNFKNVFEVDPSQVTRFAEYEKRGLMNPAALSEEASRRARSELDVLGIPLDAAAAARPTYGIVTPRLPFIASSAPKGQGQQKNVVEAIRSTLSPRNPYLEEYGAGEANVIFRPKNLDKVTTTVGDVGASAFGGVRGGVQEIGTSGINKTAKEAVFDYKGTSVVPPYLEAQMYGADLANASKVTVSTKEARNRLAQAFKEGGINVPVKVDKGAARQRARQAALQRRIDAQNARLAQQETKLRAGVDWDQVL